jgi:hypothetical protein
MTRAGGMNRFQDLGHLFETLVDKGRGIANPLALPRLDERGRA